MGDAIEQQRDQRHAIPTEEGRKSTVTRIGEAIERQRDQ
jgi:hypothetical protein